MVTFVCEYCEYRWSARDSGHNQCPKCYRRNKGPVSEDKASGDQSQSYEEKGYPWQPTREEQERADLEGAYGDPSVKRTGW